MNIRPWTWWLVLVALLAAGEGLGWLLVAQGAGAAGQAVMWVGRVLAAGWIGYGLMRWNRHPWVRRTAALVVGTVAAALAALLFISLGSANGAIAVAGIYAMAVVFFGGLLGVRLALSPGHPVLGVARTLVDEAIRMKVPLVFIIVVILLVPALPFVLDPQELLRYRIQSFLVWSMTAVSVLLSMMTVFLAVGTITSEVQHRQIFLTMTKPVGRGAYLLGKWVGIMALNLLLVAVCGAGIYAFTMILARQPATSAADRAAVTQQVLTARRSESPSPPPSMDMTKLFHERLARLRAADPTTYGRPGDPVSQLDPALVQSIQQQIVTQWYAIPPRGAHAYLFTGLSAVKGSGARTVQLRLKPQPTGPQPGGIVHLLLRVNDRYDPAGVRQFAESQFHIVDLPANLIDEQGNLLIEIRNIAVRDPSAPGGVREQGTISFNTSDGLELLYKVGGFNTNFLRALGLMWVRLGFFAMLGLAAGTYLSFPVACLLALLVYVTAALSGYLTESLTYYSAFPQDQMPLWDKIVWVPTNLVAKLGAGEIWEAIKIIIRLIGSGFMLLVPSLGDYNAIPLISDGRWVPPRMLGGALLWVGVVWTGVTALIAWLIYRRRELARVTV